MEYFFHLCQNDIHLLYSRVPPFNAMSLVKLRRYFKMFSKHLSNPSISQMWCLFTFKHPTLQFKEMCCDTVRFGCKEVENFQEISIGFLKIVKVVNSKKKSNIDMTFQIIMLKVSITFIANYENAYNIH